MSVHLFVSNPNPFAPGDFAKTPCDVVVTVWPLRNQTIKCRSQVNFFFLHVSYSCNSNLNETKRKSGTSTRFEPMAFALTQLQSILIFFSFAYYDTIFLL